MADAAIDDWIEKTFGLRPASFVAGGTPTGADAGSASGANGSKAVSGAGTPDGADAGQSSRENEIDFSSLRTSGASCAAVPPPNLPAEHDAPPGAAPGGAAPGGGGEGGVDLGAIVSAGQLAYAIFKDGAPTAEAKSTINYAMPKNADGKLTEAMGEQQMEFPIEYMNWYGLHKCVDLRVIISWRYGLTIRGKGMYINAAYISAAGSVSNPMSVTLTVQWGPWEIEKGKTGPIAVLPFVIDCQVRNLAMSDTLTFKGHIQGNGAGAVKQR